jgi:hypothetical protein
MAALHDSILPDLFSLGQPFSDNLGCFKERGRVTTRYAQVASEDKAFATTMN